MAVYRDLRDLDHPSVLKSKSDSSECTLPPPARSPATTPPPLLSSQIQRNSGERFKTDFFPEFKWGLKMQGHGGYWSLPSRSHRVPGVWLKVSRRRGCLGAGSGVTSRLLQRKQRGWALYLSNRPVPPANCSGRAAFTRSKGSHPHKGACASAPRDGPPGIAPGQPGGRPPPRRFHPDTVLSSAPSAIAP